MKGRRCPYRRRADGQVKGLTLVRMWEPILQWPAPVRPFLSGNRTRSRAWRAGTRRQKRHAA